jgi:hypothetical protein
MELINKYMEGCQDMAGSQEPGLPPAKIGDDSAVVSQSDKKSRYFDFTLGTLAIDYVIWHDKTC